MLTVKIKGIKTRTGSRRFGFFLLKAFSLISEFLNRTNFTFYVGHRRFFEHLVDLLNHFLFGELQVMYPCRTVHMNDKNWLFIRCRANMIGYGFADNIIPEAAYGDKCVDFIRVKRFQSSWQNGADVFKRLFC